jgi:signal peptidase I
MSKYSTVLVEGKSMEPTYFAGDWLMAQWGKFAVKSNKFSLGDLLGPRVATGDVVVIERPEQPGIFYVKRITEVREATGQIFVSSDNPEGTDSRQWGLLSVVCVRAKVISRIRKKR